ncbi:hypothetical protein TKK_0003183 [Trichogramma kaykai]
MTVIGVLPTTINSSISNTFLYCDLPFHHVHGKSRTTNNGLTTSWLRALGEFNNTIVIANQALRDGEMFEVVIGKMVDRWSGTIEATVTAIRLDELEFPSTMTDIHYDTLIRSGVTLMLDGAAVCNNYACDLDELCKGNHIGMIRQPDDNLHYYFDGVDQGVACADLPAHVYPVMDLYGQCAQTINFRVINLEPPIVQVEESNECFHCLARLYFLNNLCRLDPMEVLKMYYTMDSKYFNKVYRTKFDYYKHVHEAHKDRCPIALHLSDKCWGIRKMNQEPEVPPTPPSSPDDADAPTTLPIKKRLSLEFHWRPSGFAPYSMAKANNFNA